MGMIHDGTSRIEAVHVRSLAEAAAQSLREAIIAGKLKPGERLIEHESALDREFAEGKITPAALAGLTAQIGETQGQLRLVHLKYHLTTAELLTAHQRHRYAELRGYH